MPLPRVLHVITGLGTGGAEASLLRVLAHSEGAAQHMVVSLTTEGTRSAELAALHVPLQALGLARGTLAPRAAFALRRHVRDFQPDVVHGWMYHGNLAASVASVVGGARIPVVWGVRHALDAWPEETVRLRQLIRLSAPLSRWTRAIAYNSSRSAAQHARRGFDAGRAIVIPNGVCVSRFTRDEVASRAVRQAAGIPHDAIVIGMLARVHPLKDHQTFLSAAVRMAQLDARVWFLLAGRGTAGHDEAPDGTIDAMVAQAVRVDASLTSRLVRLGERRDVAAVLGACDIVCVTSTSEGSPNAAAEAMACGVPCVVTDVGDAAQLVGDTGRVIAVRDVDGLCSAWRELANDALLRRTLGAAARTRVRTNFTASAEAAAYVDLWRRVARSPALARRAA